jgi:hypothetical protein
LPLVYDELRKLAAQKLAQEKPGQTLQATALVHEAYVRLVDVDKEPHWNSRGHFFAAAAEAMRRILVENARQRRSAKHGGQLRRIDFEDVQSLVEPPSDELLPLGLAGWPESDRAPHRLPLLAVAPEGEQVGAGLSGPPPPLLVVHLPAIGDDRYRTGLVDGDVRLAVVVHDGVAEKVSIAGDACLGATSQGPVARTDYHHVRSEVAGEGVHLAGPPRGVNRLDHLTGASHEKNLPRRTK